MGPRTVGARSTRGQSIVQKPTCWAGGLATFLRARLAKDNAAGGASAVYLKLIVLTTRTHVPPRAGQHRLEGPFVEALAAVLAAPPDSTHADPKHALRVARALDLAVAYTCSDSGVRLCRFLLQMGRPRGQRGRACCGWGAADMGIMGSCCW